MSSKNDHAEKKRKGADGGLVPVKVESLQAAAPAVPPRDHSALTPIQRLLRVELQKDDPDAVEKALTQLADLCLNSNADAENNREAVTAAGGGAVIAIIMDKWNAVPAIQGEGCRALLNVSCRNDGFKESAKDTGAIDAVIWAMKEHPNDSSVQADGCGALANLAFPKSNVEYVVELKGVELIVTAMKKFKDNAKLQNWGSLTLDNLLVWDDFKKTIKEAGGRRALLDAIENHEDETKEHVKDLQLRARSALKKLL